MAKTTLYQKFKAFERRLNTAKYHKLAEKSALQALANLELERGKLDVSTKRTCDEYAHDVLGSSVYAPWLYVYSSVTGEFKEGWIPNNYYGKVVISALKSSYGDIASLKAFTRQLFKNSMFPDLVYRVNGLWLTTDNESILEDEVADIIFKDVDKVVFKKDHSGRGKGVYIIEKKSFDKKNLSSLGNGVFQRFIDQHQFFSSLMPNSVATLRLTTTVDDSGQVSVRTCNLRLGRSVDAHIKSESQLKIPIGIDSGVLYPDGYFSSWQTVKKHPDTQVPFQGKAIPGFNKCISAALALQMSVPQVRCVGWDMIINSHDEVEVMEWNGAHNGIAFPEATQGPCFADLGWENLWRR